MGHVKKHGIAWFMYTITKHGITITCPKKYHVVIVVFTQKTWYQPNHDMCPKMWY